MPREFTRSDRVAQMLSRELAMIFRNQVSDGRVSGLTITDVEVTKDLRQAKVFVTQMTKQEVNQQLILDALDKAKGFLRRQLASQIDMRHCPNLVFVYDNSIAHGAKMSALIDKALNSNN